MVVSGTEARLDHGKSNILGRKTTEHAAMALSSQRRAEGWEVGGEGLIRTLRPRPSQMGRKRDFFFSSSFFFFPPPTLKTYLILLKTMGRGIISSFSFFFSKFSHL